jgi:hypothetical protein
MIDDKKVIGLLQAKALGCLDEDENTELQSFINEGFVFPWDELGTFQNTAAILPLALQLEIPEPELKDKIALKLIKLTEELRIKKSLEEEQQKIPDPQELIEEEIDEVVDDFSDINETFVEPAIEVETEPIISSEIENLNTPLNADELSFNLDDIELPGFESVSVTDQTITQNEFENLSIESSVNTLVDEPQITAPSIEELKVDDVWIEPATEPEPQIIIAPEVVEVKTVVETKLVEEAEDTNKQPDFTKKSVAEKVFKTLEQDFDRLKYHTEEMEGRLKRGLMIAFVVIAFLAALLIVLFFKFSSDINNQQKEIDYLKSRPTSTLFNSPEQFKTSLYS